MPIVMTDCIFSLHFFVQNSFYKDPERSKNKMDFCFTEHAECLTTEIAKISDLLPKSNEILCHFNPKFQSGV
jgi:hypothetical protein